MQGRLQCSWSTWLQPPWLLPFSRIYLATQNFPSKSVSALLSCWPASDSGEPPRNAPCLLAALILLGVVRCKQGGSFTRLSDRGSDRESSHPSRLQRSRPSLHLLVTMCLCWFQILHSSPKPSGTLSLMSKLLICWLSPTLRELTWLRTLRKVFPGSLGMERVSVFKWLPLQLFAARLCAP